MAQTIKAERLRWVIPIVKREITLVAATRVCPYSQRSLERWLAAYKKSGDQSLEPKSTRPKTSPRETPIRIKEEVIALRRETKLCAQKLHWRLKKRGLRVPVRTIAKIIKNEKLVRTYRKKKIKYSYLKAELKPGELMEIDVKYVPGTVAGKEYFQYTAIDCATRWRHLAVYDEQTNFHSIKFLTDVMARFPHPIRAVKTDNGAIFTNWYVGTTKRTSLTVKTLHVLDQFCTERGIVHYLIDPGKPAQNGKVERSHREDEEKFYQQNRFLSFGHLRQKLRLWNIYYNNLEHCGLNGKTPNGALAEYNLISPPNVYA